MRILLFFLFCWLIKSGTGQTTLVKSFPSKLLNEERVIRLQLPKSFDTSPEKRYPLILCLDGDYLFYSTLGNTHLLSPEYLDQMPEVIVVGIDQNYPAQSGDYTRWLDCNYNEKSGFPEHRGLLFKSFIGEELLPWLQKKYRTGSFKVIVGHSFTANYIHYFLFDSPRLFGAYIALSPFIPEPIRDSVATTLRNTANPLFYYLCTSENDLRGHKQSIEVLDSLYFRPIRNKHLHYAYANYPEAGHMSLIKPALSEALSFVFSHYAPVEDVPASLLQSADSLLAFLKQKYIRIRDIYGLDMPYREGDLLSISSLIEELEAWDQLRELGEITVSVHPESSYGYYMLGTVEEKRGNLEKALAYYKTGFSKLSAGVLNKADFYLDIERVEKRIRENPK